MFVLGHIVLLTVLFVGVGGVSICPIHATPSHPIRLHGDACYQFHMRESRDFSAAQAECRSQGGSGVIIRDSDTQRFLFDTIEREFHYRGVVWIGLNDIAKEGSFTWVDGSPVTFSFWAPGQPGFFGSLEDCVAMDMRDGGHWYDYLCEDFLFINAPHPFICQFPLQYIGNTPRWRPWHTTRLTTPTAEPTAVTIHPDVSMTTSPDTAVSMTTVTGSTEVHAVTMHPDVSMTTNPDTTVSMTTVTGSTEALESTAPMTTVPKTTVHIITVPDSTVPVTTVPKTTVPMTTVPELTTVPKTTVPM
ncbi:uncharacterized protein, partial [Littorina saxatilis]|uniref:uncharacterized protein n=1 Tax=Littorina saxatilis TaxID=31220 RepID=UPI0038B4766A